MPGGLPPVLTTNTKTISGQINNADRVQVEDVARLWRVYALNSAHIEDDEGTRLENFFWRIWSNQRIFGSIRGSTLARLFITISEGRNRVRTTPVPSPLGATPTQNVTFQPAPLAAAKVMQTTPTEGARSEVSSNSTGAAGSPCETSDQSRTLPPILKKSRTGCDGPLRSPKTSSHFAQMQEPAALATRKQSSESTEHLPSPFAAAEKGSKNAGKKRTSFVAAPGTRKARPGIVRKKSSQSSASNEQRKSSQPSPSPRMSSAKNNPQAMGGLPAAAFAGPSLTLPSSSWQDVDSPASSRSSLDSTFSTSQQPSSWLVDKNFRGRFVETQKRANSSINLADLGKSQSVRFLDELSEHKKPVGGGRARTEKIGSKAPETVGRPEPSPAPTVSGAIEEATDEDMPSLPRTKSQLSMLINRERKHSGSANLGPNLLTQVNRGANDQGNEENDEEEENELLVMARRDKKGKAKDPDQPFRAAAKKGFRGHGGDGGDGPRSPPPVF